MAHENTFKRQGTETGAITIPSLNPITNIHDQSNTHSLFLVIPKGYQLSMAAVDAVLPKTTVGVLIRKYLRVLEGDGQCVELNLLPRVLQYNYDTHGLYLYWFTNTNQSCILQDYLQFVIQDHKFLFEHGQQTNTLIINLGII